jgi:hypothetical protein
MSIAYACLGGTFRIVDTDICTISLRRDDKLAKLIPEKPDGNTLHDVLHHKVHVTNNDTDDSNPDYSPDGNRIVYEGFEGSYIKEQNVEDASTNIYTIKAGGGGNFNLTKSPKRREDRLYGTRRRDLHHQRQRGREVPSH